MRFNARTLCRQDCISDVAVVGLPHLRWIEAVTAVVAPKAGRSHTEAEVLAHAAAQLAPFKCPMAVLFVDSLSKNPVGKLLKRELRQCFGAQYASG